MTWQVIQGDCLDILREMESGSVDAVVTDPPYPREFQPLYGQMASQLPRILKPGGSLLAIVPHYSLPEIMADVGAFLKYRWTLCMWQDKGSHPRMAMGIEVMWKPIVWWVNERWPQGRGFIRDGFENARPSKQFHPWEQSLTWAEYCLKLVPPGGTVLDPFLGAGTSGIAAIQNGYHFIGIEKDQSTVEIARKRISEAAAARQELLPLE